VIGTGTVDADERHRLFCALRLPAPVLDTVAAWQPRALDAPRARSVARENLHVTLAFLGARPASEVPAIAAELRAAARAAGPIHLSLGPRSYRETRSVGMLVLDDSDGAASALAGEIGARLERLGVLRREQRPWTAHLTVVRFRERPRLQPDPPRLARFSPSDAALYTSVLRPDGAQYDVLESVALGGG